MTIALLQPICRCIGVQLRAYVFQVNATGSPAENPLISAIAKAAARLRTQDVELNGQLALLKSGGGVGTKPVRTPALGINDAAAAVGGNAPRVVFHVWAPRTKRFASYNVVNGLDRPELADCYRRPLDEALDYNRESAYVRLTH